MTSNVSTPTFARLQPTQKLENPHSRNKTLNVASSMFELAFRQDELVNAILNKLNPSYIDLGGKGTFGSNSFNPELENSILDIIPGAQQAFQNRQAGLNFYNNQFPDHSTRNYEI